jgi:translocation and assembly module TamA
MRRIIFITLFLIVCLPLCAQGYDVEVKGLEDKALKKTFLSTSQSYCLKDKSTPPLSVIKRRAQNDQEKLVERAFYYGYYSAKVSYTIQHAEIPKVLFRVELGPKYTLEAFNLEAASGGELPNINITDLKLTVGKPITTQAIIDAEKALVWQLKKKGYAFSQVLKKECIANAHTHTLSVKFLVSLGPLVRFGPTSITGNKTVLSQTIEKDILWKNGAVYDPNTIEKTQERLDATGLFSSVIISEEPDGLEEGPLPMRIHVQEGKHHSIGAGLAYATSFGPGIKAEWENKNLRGLGEKLTFRTEIWKKYRQAVLSLTKPHFQERNQDLIWVAEYDKLHNIAFNSDSYNLSTILQKRQSQHTEIVFGARYQWLDSHNFEGHHLYHLIKLPFQFKYSRANNLLDPTKGETLNIKLTPTSHVLTPTFVYTIHTTSLAAYHSPPNNHVTFAAKAVVGNIIGAARHTIPPPDRFYGGSENVLRGFRAFTVSPLHHKRTPIGGRSLLAGTLEARFRSAGALGWAFFYDVGNVYTTNMPKITRHQFHSVGTGLRYMTPIGPLRFDVAVPINPRPHIDPHFQIYFSIGQSF